MTSATVVEAGRLSKARWRLDSRDGERILSDIEGESSGPFAEEPSMLSRRLTHAHEADVEESVASYILVDMEESEGPIWRSQSGGANFGQRSQIWTQGAKFDRESWTHSQQSSSAASCFFVFPWRHNPSSSGFVTRRVSSHFGLPDSTPSEETDRAGGHAVDPVDPVDVVQERQTWRSSDQPFCRAVSAVLP